MKGSVIKLMMWGNLNTDMFAGLSLTSSARTSIRRSSAKYDIIRQEEAEG